LIYSLHRIDSRFAASERRGQAQEARDTVSHAAYVIFSHVRRVFNRALLRLPYAIVGNQAVHNVLMNLDLSLLDQRVPQAGLEQGIPVSRTLGLNFVANRGPLLV